MKLYTFFDEEGKIITEVRAENHDKAIFITGLPFMTEFCFDSLPDDNGNFGYNEGNYGNYEAQAMGLMSE